MRLRAILEFYLDEAERHRWRLLHTNGRIVAASTQSYSRLADARHNARSTTLYHLRPGIKVVTGS